MNQEVKFLDVTLIYEHHSHGKVRLYGCAWCYTLRLIIEPIAHLPPWQLVLLKGSLMLTPYKLLGSPNLHSGWYLFLCVCWHRNSPNYVCPIFRHALNGCAATLFLCVCICNYTLGHGAVY